MPTSQLHKQLIISLFTLSLILIMARCNSFKADTDSATKIDMKVVDSTINKALDYFSKEQLNIKYPDAIMLIFILRNHFGLKFPFPSVAEFEQKYPELHEKYFKIYDNYFDDKDTFSFPRKDVEYYLKNNYANDIASRFAWSMYCSSYPLPTDFLQIIKTKINELIKNKSAPENLIANNNVYQIKNIEYANCWQNKAELDSVMLLVKGLLIKIIEEKKLNAYNQDTKFEAIAMLYYLGFDDFVKPTYIKMIINNQFPEGGWGVTVENRPKYNIQATIMGVWALLEYKEFIAS